MKYFLPLLLFPFISFAQTKDTTVLNEVVVSGIQEQNSKQTSLNIESYSLQQLENKIPYNLSDALTNIPGVSQLNTGNAISKPVIRGLYGNRILILLSGLRFDNQQFQDEHGLGLSQIGIDRVELIKGPASILYGTDAVGGIINIIEEAPFRQGEHTDATVRLYSNTLGTLTDVGYSKRSGQHWWRVRGGVETNADYKDGNGERVLDSRNKGYYFKTGVGFNKRRWTQNNSYNFSYNQYGFILDGNSVLQEPGDRYSRSMAGPHHNVMLNVFSSQNTIRLSTSDIKFNIGAQSNRRKEDEGGGEISLDMHLLSILENFKWEKSFSAKLNFVVNQQSTFEKNTNYGKRILIPDANMLENNLSCFLQYHSRKMILEAGVGLNNKYIRTFNTGILNIGSMNTPDTSMHAFTRDRNAFNALLGASYNPIRWLNIKLNISSGNRSANLAELSSNGLHEGVYRCEIGDPNLKMEQNVNSGLTAEVNSKKVFLSGSAFYNYFANYIYLTRSGKPDWYGFERYMYTQQNATLYGGELVGIAKFNRHLQLKETYTVTRGVLQSGDDLPFIPAAKTTTSIKFDTDINDQWSGLYFEPSFEYTFRQDHPAQFETSTADYGLVNVTAGITSAKNNSEIHYSISCRNLLDKAYVDHLSRLKYYGINNPGINIVLSVHIQLGRG
ncbi:MAG: TonB-dependent receptor [Bacteroidetes bacterium]|nr:TonB-dependent receptor [Bacteroidota bacterium]